MERAQTNRCFDMLGFTHYWARSRGLGGETQDGQEALSAGRSKRLAQWCREHRHRPVAEQHEAINRKLRGHYAYYGVTGNARALNRYRWLTERVWRKWLNRRNHRGPLTWVRFKALLQRYPLLPPRVVHSIYPRAANP